MTFLAAQQSGRFRSGADVNSEKCPPRREGASGRGLSADHGAKAGAKIISRTNATWQTNQRISGSATATLTARWRLRYYGPRGANATC